MGLHWLTVGPEGLQVTTPDDSVRRRSWEYVRGLVELCADLRQRDTGSVMVFGSPNQRRAVGGATRQQAERNYIEGVRSIVPDLEATGVTLCVEALPIGQCDVIVTLDRAAEIVDEIGSPMVQTMFDSHNAIDETEPHHQLVARHWPKIRHIHVNELDGTYPRPSEEAMTSSPCCRSRRTAEFPGWVSMEVFDFSPGAETIVNESFSYLTGEVDRLR